MELTKEEYIEKNKELIAKYPFLLPRNAWTGKVHEDYDYSYNALEIAIYPAWWDKFGELWCEDFLSVCEEAGVDPNHIFITQAKEKWAKLCVYLNGYPTGWLEHEYAWNYISEHTCWMTGEFPVPVLDDGYELPWSRSAWEECRKGYDRELKYDDCIVGEWCGRLDEYVVVHRWDSDGKHEVWIDMKPYYKKIGWDFEDKDLVLREEMEEEREKLRKERQEDV